MNDVEMFGFEKALQLMKERVVVSRKQFGNDIVVFAQYPTPTSKMTEPYIVMRKYANRNQEEKYFPVDLSVESLFADDWYLVEEKDIEQTI